MPKLVLVRHGQSLWNLEQRFTGWIDVPLTEAGRHGARQCARLVSDVQFDVAYTSALCRALDTLVIMLAELGQQPPIIRDAALNERHYGDLQGLYKAETVSRYGAEQVRRWRRSYDVAPPGGESLQMTARRTLPFFERVIGGDLAKGKNVLVVAHGNSLRAIVMKLDGLSSEAVLELEVNVTEPIIYELDPEGRVFSKRVR
jgi:2,3-bisphosphoglycerate-dependent phosphoglycerate mutase